MRTRTLLQLPYQAARIPLTVLDATLLKRLPADSPPRLVFERLLGSLDIVAGRLLGDRGVEHRGAGLREHADTLSDAVKLEQDAEQRRRAAAGTVQEARRQASTLREDAQHRQREGVQEAVENERRDRGAATRRARTQASTAKQQADARAASRLEMIEQKRTSAEARADARTRRATTEAKANLSEAAQKKAGAASRRAEADELATLSEAKQQARKR
ncbi:MAG: hypothetical protein DLM57_15130 [Pseudonocardiales bacterium]|nr:MAG: hypothetical protein DLM57_15130 [Pseudonocardiales bacterium]